MLLLSGCSGPTVVEEPVESVPVTLRIPLTEGKTALYTIIRSDYDDASVSSLASEFLTGLMAQTGSRYPITTDRLGFNEKLDPEAREILLGATNRTESMKCAESIGVGGYAVTQIENKIIVYGNTKDAQKEAVTTFMNALEKDEAGDLFLVLPSEGLRSDGETNLFAGGAAERVIASSKGNEDLAQGLAKEILKRCALTMPVKRLSELKSETAIKLLSGKEAEAELGSALMPSEYRILAKGNQLILAGGSTYSLKQAISKFESTYVNDRHSLTLEVPASVDIGNNILNQLSYIDRTEGSDLRIMSYNILCELWADAPLEGRDDLVSSVIMTYMPDVAGLCEVSDKWYEHLDGRIGFDYKFLNMKTREGRTNFTGMIYNPSTVKVITSSCELFSAGNSPTLRLMNWGLFEKLDGGQRFIVMNTHWDITQKDTVWNAYRLVQSKQMAERVVALHEQYKCPVIVTGDYNAVRVFEEFQQYERISGTKDAMVTADKIINGEYRTYHALGGKPMNLAASPIDVTSFSASVPTAIVDAFLASGQKLTYQDINAIDHITYTTDVHALLCHNIVDDPVNQSSDHTPIYADFRFGDK